MGEQTEAGCAGSQVGVTEQNVERQVWAERQQLRASAHRLFRSVVHFHLFGKFPQFWDF